jgi:hypothetical protein
MKNNEKKSKTESNGIGIMAKSKIVISINGGGWQYQSEKR